MSATVQLSQGRAATAQHGGLRRACATQGLKEKKLAQDNLDKVFAWRLTQGMGRAQGLKEKKLAQDNLDKVDKLKPIRTQDHGPAWALTRGTGARAGPEGEEAGAGQPGQGGQAEAHR